MYDFPAFHSYCTLIIPSCRATCMHSGTLLQFQMLKPCDVIISGDCTINKEEGLLSFIKLFKDCRQCTAMDFRI